MRNVHSKRTYLSGDDDIDYAEEPRIGRSMTAAACEIVCVGYCFGPVCFVKRIERTLFVGDIDSTLQGGNNNNI